MVTNRVLRGVLQRIDCQLTANGGGGDLLALVNPWEIRDFEIKLSILYLLSVFKLTWILFVGYVC